jgi:hypothetical protein
MNFQVQGTTLNPPRDAKLLLGPAGGFRAFSMNIRHHGEDLSIALVKDQRKAWIWLERILAKYNIDVDIEKIPQKPPKPRQKAEE